MIIGPTPHKGEVFVRLGLRWHKRTFFDMPSSRGDCISPPPFLSTPGALTTSPKVPMGPLTCWKSCATLPWRSWTFKIALKFRPLRGSEFPVARGPRCVMHPASQRRSCQGLFLEAQPTEVSVVGGWFLHQILGGQVSHR